MKPHILLVHSFPTNSVLLHGLEEFLADFFTVHFIDLPGFHKDVPALGGAVTLKKFSNYFDQKVTELKVDEYVVAGVSFGFLVVNNAKLDKRCKAVIALEPFIGTDYLNLSFPQKKKYLLFTNLFKIFRIFGLEKSIWHSRWFEEYLQKESSYDKERVDIIIKHINPKTFFSVAELLMSYNKEVKFHNLPHFLMGNFQDKTINFDRTLEVFVKNLHEVFVISEPVDHYPQNPTKSYFKDRIPAIHLQHVVNCLKT